MPLQPLDKTFKIAWLNHDSWTESYIGTRKLVYEVLPAKNNDLTEETSALCQLAVVGANHMMEVALFGLIRPHIGSQLPDFSITQKQFDNGGYHKALTNWVEPITGSPLDLSAEPFLSTELLRKRRNDTVHKSSAIATVEMARAALYSAVEGTKALYTHFGNQSKYRPFLEKYPVHQEPMFSSVQLP
ncbi:hypothetical protein SAMN05660420_01287 [Desulfuromusa kysingii]|uniref:Uncharacterized protein n=1 Tax=Desulfuromusa kysingii TaxID=37625 RepID=A0A1H3YL18_9BACT|nr:hypothetical protein [Desulfuromusa kysingii]SEA12299.1 hypothetical protein SAMN05660420_01287 [Desulfuromusa kysingii]